MKKKETIIEVKDIFKEYHLGGVVVKALDGVSFSVDEGDFIVIVGQVVQVKVL